MSKESERTMIGYVCIPFGTKAGVDYTKIYEEAIFPAARAVAPSEPRNVYLFREDESVPELTISHRRRLERFGFADLPAETRLREEIQRHIILADFLIAEISTANPNVMLEVGFAQALNKRVIYLTHSMETNPSNLGDLKRFLVYQKENLTDLKTNLWLKINEVIGELKDEDRKVMEHGGKIQYYPQRQAMPLADILRNAQSVIQILTTNLTTVSANYREAILSAIERAEQEGRTLEATILTSDPSNPYIKPRANQLGEEPSGYESELVGGLRSVAAKLQGKPNCSVLTYDDFPVQLWHRVDGMIYIGSPSLIRRSRANCVFGVSVDVPGIRETFLDHFDELKRKATPYSVSPLGDSDVLT